MRVLTVSADHGSRSYSHAVLKHFEAALRQAGHTTKIGRHDECLKG